LIENNDRLTLTSRSRMERNANERERANLLRKKRMDNENTNKLKGASTNISFEKYYKRVYVFFNF